MRAEIHNDTVSGSLFLLAKKESFMGMIGADGGFVINGTLSTLLRSVPYRAIGFMTENEVRMEMECDGERYSLCGISEEMDW